MKSGLAVFLFFATAFGAMARPTAVYSLEYLSDLSPQIGVYTVTSATRHETAGGATFDLELKRADSLKGDAPATASQANSYYVQKPDDTAQADLAAGDRFLVFFHPVNGGGESVIATMIILSKPRASYGTDSLAVNAKSQVLTHETAILDTVRARVAAHPGTDAPAAKTMIGWGVYPEGELAAINTYDITYLMLPEDLRAPLLARQDAREIADALGRYYAAKHVMPRGGNGEITGELVKKNRQGERPLYLDVETRYNKQWELCDPWGSPYRINASNPKFPWAYSCGPDKIDNGGAPGSDDAVSW